MKRIGVVIAVGLLLAFVAAAAAQGPELRTARGKVEKVGKDALQFQPRGADGKFGKTIVLSVTGTSRITLLGSRKMGTKTVPTQRDANLQDLTTGQLLAVIYLADKDKDTGTLLSAVALPMMK